MNLFAKAGLISTFCGLMLSPAIAQGNNHSFAGAYLAANSAIKNNELEAASSYLTRALVRAPQNEALMNALIYNQIALGKVDAAVPVAKLLLAANPENRTAILAVTAKMMKTGDGLDPSFGQESDNIFNLLMAWSDLGQGDMTNALARFDTIAEVPGFKNFAFGQKALALALVGDYQGADDILSGRAHGTMTATRRSVISHAQILSQLDRPAAALELLDSIFPNSSNPEIVAMRTLLVAGAPVVFDRITSATDGQAEVLFELANFLDGDGDANSALLYGRLAEYLRADFTAATLMVARVLEDIEQFDLATKAYERVSPEAYSYFEAEIGRSNALANSDKTEEAIEVLRKLAETHGDNPSVHSALGDLFRGESRFDEAAETYDKAIAMLGEPTSFHWIVYYSRAISLERTGHWEEAEGDFRYALTLRPNHPAVLNYLGYSYVEKGENLDEALEMIQTAVAERPTDGFITDSLGWAFYKLGRYQDAVEPMEKAVELTPLDPIINDHLGDVYWAVGRQREATFQWRRAISFEPEETDLERIRRKLDVGLDVVLQEEGADPLPLTSGG